MLDIVTAQSAAIEPETFQSALIANMSAALLRQPSPLGGRRHQRPSLPRLPARCPRPCRRQGVGGLQAVAQLGQGRVQELDGPQKQGRQGVGVKHEGASLVSVGRRVAAGGTFLWLRQAATSQT